MKKTLKKLMLQKQVSHLSVQYVFSFVPHNIVKGIVHGKHDHEQEPSTHLSQSIIVVSVLYSLYLYRRSVVGSP